MSIDKQNTNLSNNDFILNLHKYIGSTITVYTVNNNPTQCGFTGVLLLVNCDMISLVTKIGPSPYLPTNNQINFKRINTLGNINKQNINSYNNCLGTITDIPIDKITAIVHNTI